MKKFLHLLIVPLLASAALLTGCGNGGDDPTPEPEPPKFILTSDGFSFTGASANMRLTNEQKNYVIALETNATQTWTATVAYPETGEGKTGFLTVSPLTEQTGPGSLSVNCAENTGKTERKATVTIRYGSKTYVINVAQLPYTLPTVLVSPNKMFSIDDQGGDKAFAITSYPAGAEFEYEEANNWITPVAGQTTTWNFAVNDSKDWRGGKIYIYLAGKHELLDSITVIQAGYPVPTVTVTPAKTIVVDNLGGERAFTVNTLPSAANISYRIDAPDDSWITPVAGKTTTWNVAASGSGNARTGKIYIVYEDKGIVIDSITINQLDNSPVTEVETPIPVPAAGNSYCVVGSVSIPESVGGGFSLSNTTNVVDMYFRVGKAGVLNLGLVGNAGGSSNTGVVKATVLGMAVNVTMTGSATKFYSIGKFNVTAPGYIKVSLQGVSKTGGSYYGTVTGLKIGGAATTGTNNFVTEAKVPTEQYWSRRGPSVHLNYTIGSNIEYFYNELTVPEGNDVIGSYFMTNGFGEGYCGFQVKSASERWVLFSVWSPFKTDDPKTIPADQKVTVVRKGQGVTAQEFGGEGSGGQSYLVYPWKAGVTYKILTQVKYYGTSSFSTYPHLTEYTAYFFDPVQNAWRLIAAWRRPDTSIKTYTGAHSFLENFKPEQGWITREVNFGNQWTRNLSGQWTEVTQCRFTYDNTAAQGLRADYYGGTNGNKFVLKNCGFFDSNTVYNTTFTRTANGASAMPDIDLEALKAIPSVGM